MECRPIRQARLPAGSGASRDASPVRALAIPRSSGRVQPAQGRPEFPRSAATCTLVCHGRANFALRRLQPDRRACLGRRRRRAIPTRTRTRGVPSGPDRSDLSDRSSRGPTRPVESDDYLVSLHAGGSERKRDHLVPVASDRVRRTSLCACSPWACRGGRPSRARGRSHSDRTRGAGTGSPIRYRGIQVTTASN
jgi:hypothetical protein